MADDHKCPKCGSATILRTRKKDKRKFYICIRYPQCKGKVEYDEEWDDWEDKESPAKVKSSLPKKLIECPDCGKPVSRLAETCPNCGYPIGGRINEAHGGKVQTIEFTSKWIKVEQIIAVIFMLLGLLIMSMGCIQHGNKPSIIIGILFMVVGLVLGIVSSISRWWYHG